MHITCKVCKKETNKAYCVVNNIKNEYYCSSECAFKKYTINQWWKLYKEGLIHWIDLNEEDNETIKYFIMK